MDLDRTSIEKLIEDSTFRNWVMRSNQEDFEKWERLLNRDVHLKQIAEEAKSIILITELAEDGISELENQEALQHLRRKIEMKEAVVHSSAYAQAPTPVKSLPWMRYAAAVIFILMALGASFYFSIYSSKDNPVTEQVLTKHSTKSGQFLTLQLADGSKIKLNSNTTVHLPENFLGNRTVRLEGEAFFDVAKNNSLPFRVITEKFSVEVVGTSFDVDSYKDQRAKVSVKSGIVTVKTNLKTSNTLTLTKQEAAQFDESKQELAYTNFDPDDFLWKDGILIFRDDNIEAIAEKLEQWYGVTVKISNPEKVKGQFTGTYEKEGLDNMLEGISYVLNFSYNIDNTRKEVIIHPN